MSSPTPDPSSASSFARFRDTALASGLVQPEALAAAEAEVRRQQGTDAADPAAWDRALADRLVSGGLLTKFQAREMLAGRRRFRLGQYTVLDEIGRGGMGQVFRAEHAMMGREVALKVLPRAKATPEYEAAFHREIRVLASLDHENLVRALDAGHDAKVYYLVTELVPGIDLRRQVLKYGPLDEPAAAAVITQAAQGLAYAHDQGLVHRDVKPGNILVTQDGRVKVLDLGLAGSMFDAESTTTGRVVGTMDYMAPEQIRSPDLMSPAADIYGLGCTLYFALAGQVPFPGGTRKEKAHRQLHERPTPLAELVPHIDAGLRRVVEDMMHKSPAERIGSAAEVIQRLRPWTPRTQVPMPRVPVAAGGRPAAEPGRPLPPPIPAPPPHGRADSSAAGSSASQSGLGGPLPTEEMWPLASDSDGLQAARTPRSPAVPASGNRPGHGVGRAGSSAWLVAGGPGVAPALARAAGIAAVVAVVFGVVLRLIQAVDSERFKAVLGGMSPLALGCLAFAMLLAAQVAAIVSAGPRR
jgi:serine/threonine protein kinase